MPYSSGSTEKVTLRSYISIHCTVALVQGLARDKCPFYATANMGAKCLDFMHYNDNKMYKNGPSQNS
jgi:hypothetical protein